MDHRWVEKKTGLDTAKKCIKIDQRGFERTELEEETVREIFRRSWETRI
jgi:hypothetical protein